MKQYNFFTARFYTAFDLELEQEKPDLLMITDPFISPYTMLDVDTDCIQICGRFRNGISSATHIYRTNEEIIAKTKEQLEWEISAHEFAYQTVQTLYNSADSKEVDMDLEKHLKPCLFAITSTLILVRIGLLLTTLSMTSWSRLDTNTEDKSSSGTMTATTSFRLLRISLITLMMKS